MPTLLSDLSHTLYNFSTTLQSGLNLPWSKTPARICPTSPPALTAHRRTRRSSQCAHHTTCSCLMTPCESPSCWQLGWQTPPQGRCGQTDGREEGSAGKLWDSQIPATFSRMGWGCSRCPPHSQRARRLQGIPLHPLVLLGFQPGFRLLQFLGIHHLGNKPECKDERGSSAKASKAQLQEKRDHATPHAWKEGRVGRRKVAQGTWDRLKHILRELIRPESHSRNQVLNQLLIHNSPASARQRVWMTRTYGQFLQFLGPGAAKSLHRQQRAAPVPPSRHPHPAPALPSPTP